ncbi:MAG: GNAT family N-acetyltransferase [Deltaproteobacteria bacterium]|nr:GNAT family N-acetyltransferase [Deltaproteobacteria bacterium]
MLQPLFDNHLSFMKTHRGDVIETTDSIILSGEAPGFTAWVPKHNKAVLPVDSAAVRLLPWSGDDWPGCLKALEYKRAEAFSYMELLDLKKTREQCVSSNYKIVVAENKTGADTFSKVQSAGFLNDVDPGSTWWRSCFRSMARCNIARTDQSFYIAYFKDIPAAVMLVVRTVGVTGIYAVTTKPEFRNQGLCGALLNYMHQDDRNAKANRFILQATVDSYAESFYERFGFVTRFQSQVWRRP